MHNTLNITFASDLAPIRRFAPMMREDPRTVYGDLLDRLDQADCRIVNLESPLAAPSGLITKSGAAFSGEPEHVSVLTSAGFHAAVLANNHAFDGGAEGFFRTQEILRQNGIATVGAGKNIAEARKPLEICRNGIRIGLFAISEGEDMLGAGEDEPGVRPWEVERLADQIREAKQKKKYDIVLVSAHCGLEYQPYPSFYTYKACKCWAEAGADLIIGHHPHVPQGMTMFGRTPVYFSLGNFAFYQQTNLFYRKTGCLLEMNVSQSGLLDHRIIPYRIMDDGLHLLKGSEFTDFHELFSRLSEPLKTEQGAREAWHAVLAYNGVSGFRSELEKILKTMQDSPEKGAAMLRNRVTCMQHRTQWIDGMSRIVEGTIDDAPGDLLAMVRDYMTREIDQ